MIHMKTLHLILFTALLMMKGVLPADTTLTTGQQEMGNELARILKGDNLFLSSYSISSALSMAWAGAKGRTAEEMQEALHLPHPGKKTHEEFRQLKTALEKRAKETGQVFEIANALCLLRGKPHKEYQDLISTFYEAEIFPGDLGRINSWVREKTRGKIDPMLDQLPGGTAAVILNAVYFKGTWETAFEKRMTREQPFHVSETETVPVPLMHRTGRMKYHETDTLQMVQLPYKGGAFSMTVVLPKAKGGLAALEKDLDAESMAGLIKKLEAAHPKEVRLFLPRFTFSTSYELSKPMQSLGMKQAFMPGGADFSGMMGNPGDVFIGSIVHKAFVDVNEEGTEAAAATAVMVRVTSVMPMEPPPLFRADHPFLFMIREHETGAILFQGRLSKPEKE